MESSSNDSFLWSDASNSSVNMSSESNISQSKEGNVPDTIQYNNKKKDKKHNKSQRKKEPESGDDCQPEKKRIKLEPESDIDKQKKKKLVNNQHEDNCQSHNSVLKDDDYLNVSVKKEQESLISPELVKLKKKKKQKNSDIDKSYETQSIINPDNSNLEHYLDKMVKEEQASFIASEVINSKKVHKYIKSDVESQPDLETSDNDFKNYLNFRVKQEQASVAEPDLTPKRKKKKKRKSSIGSSIEITPELKTVQHNDTALESDTSSCEKNVSGKRKKKRNDENVYNNFSKNKGEKITVDFEEGNTTNSDNEITYQENDFTCNNIVHSTIINKSTVETTEETKNHVAGSISTNILRIDNEYQRSTNISDKIGFEDEDTRSFVELELNKKSLKIEQFLKANPHLQIVPKIKNNGIVTEDDDIWILKCPHGMNLKKLNNACLSLEGKCRVKIDGQTYDGVANEDVTRLTVMTYHNGQACIKNLPLKGCVNYRKRIPKAHVPDNINIANDQTDSIPLPGTKCRHPLFGSDYKKAVKIPVDVAERLQAAKERNVVSCESINKKRKKNKKVETDVKIEDESNTELKTNKKRKQKHTEETAVASKKKKNKKHDRDNAEVWESEKAIEENLFNF